MKRGRSHNAHAAHWKEVPRTNISAFPSTRSRTERLGRNTRIGRLRGREEARTSPEIKAAHSLVTQESTSQQAAPPCCIPHFGCCLRYNIDFSSKAGTTATYTLYWLQFVYCLVFTVSIYIGRSIECRLLPEVEHKARTAKRISNKNTTAVLCTHHSSVHNGNIRAGGALRQVQDSRRAVVLPAKSLTRSLWRCWQAPTTATPGHGRRHSSIGINQSKQT